MRLRHPIRQGILVFVGTQSTQKLRCRAEKHSILVHRQARRALPLLLEEATAPAIAAWLQLHLKRCHRCRQALDELSQADAWLCEQSVNVPQMVAIQEAVWSAIQKSITAI